MLVCWRNASILVLGATFALFIRHLACFSSFSKSHRIVVAVLAAVTCGKWIRSLIQTVENITKQLAVEPG
jgi:hypothetical protein